MNALQRFIASRKFVKRLLLLDDLLKQASQYASTYRIMSLTKGNGKYKMVEKHRDSINKFNDQKYFWMKLRRYEV